MADCCGTAPLPLDLMALSDLYGSLAPFRPYLLKSLRDYNGAMLTRDVSAGATVGIVALPLAMAFAMASGLKPEAGIFTSILAGFLISALGGSRVQIGGPAGAFIVIVYGIVERYGLANLIIATAMSGVMLFLMGLFRLGGLIRFIPVAVVIGFTNGIAVLVALSQIKDFLGLTIASMPANFFGILHALGQHLHTLNPAALALAVTALALILFWQFVLPRVPASAGALVRRLQVLPGSIVALIVTTLAVTVLQLQVDTIGSRFGGIPSALPGFAWPAFSWETARFLLVPATTLALLGAIESLLCARVADGMIDDRHDSNQELMAQGVANFITPFFGGMPATGTIARTMTNVKSGAASPVAGIVHAATLLAIILIAAPLATNVPLAALAAVLMFVAWNMGEWREFAHLRQYRLPYRVTLLAVFSLTVIFDLTVAVEVGLIAACVTFIYRISSLSRSEPVGPADQPLLTGHEGQIAAYRLYGAIFFGAVKLVQEIEARLPAHTLVLDMKNVIYMDSSGVDSLQDLVHNCQKSNVRLIVCGLTHQPLDIAQRTGLIKLLAASADSALPLTLADGLQAALRPAVAPSAAPQLLQNIELTM
jgi:sulfate permease, SulP family